MVFVASLSIFSSFFCVEKIRLSGFSVVCIFLPVWLWIICVAQYLDWELCIHRLCTHNMEEKENMKWISKLQILCMAHLLFNVKIIEQKSFFFWIYYYNVERIMFGLRKGTHIPLDGWLYSLTLICYVCGFNEKRFRNSNIWITQLNAEQFI